jgi:5-(carboxyamino)imidazole ribonucleotide synthase
MKVLIFGAGQLARMMYLAACPLGIQVQAVDCKSEKVVNPVTQKPQKLTLEQAIEEADVLSVEFEHVPEKLLEKAHISGKLLPGIEAILAGADRVREKKLLDKLGIANCPYQIIDSVDQLDDAAVLLGERLIIKASRDGYDGYGQWRLQSMAELPELKETLLALNLKKVPLIVEKMLNFERELSMLGIRSKLGEVKFYPLTENLHHQGQLHVSVAPAPHITEQLQQQAQDVFIRLSTELDYVGVLAVEFFQVDGQLLVNEIAPRVHNSGHWTLQGADTCQFENHLRAVTGLPLGDTSVYAKSAMVNIIGCSTFSRDMLSIAGCHLHWYGKTVRPKRKMGHFNLLARDYASLAEAMYALAKYLPNEHFPLLGQEAARLSKI